MAAFNYELIVLFCLFLSRVLYVSEISLQSFAFTTYLTGIHPQYFNRICSNYALGVFARA